MSNKSQTALKQKLENSELKDAISERLSAIATMLADSCLLAVWALSTWGVNFLLTKLELSSFIEKVALNVFQWLFLISTLIPVLAYTLVDLKKVIQHTLNEMKKR